MPDFIAFLVFTCGTLTGSSLVDLKSNIVKQYENPHGYVQDLKAIKKKAPKTRIFLVGHKSNFGKCA